LPAARAGLSPTGRRRALLGDPAEKLVELSDQLDVLVCGSRGYGPLRAVLLVSLAAGETAA
jgi:nucleotide-binding universal stress UspA family protein